MKLLNFKFKLLFNQNSFYGEIALMARFLFINFFHEMNENLFLYKFSSLKNDYFQLLYSN